MDTDLPALRTVLVEQFSLSELRTLCHDLGVNHEELTTGPLGDLARELVEHCRRRDRIADLVAAVEAARPGALAAAGAPRKSATVALPFDHIPAITPLPRGSRMPFRPNPAFVGRDDALRQLAAALTAGGVAAIGQVVAATGLGGIGKTSLAAEFVHRYGQFFPGGVFWLSFAEAGAIPGEIAVCGGPEGMNLSELAGLTLPEQSALVQRAWREATPRLLVFDNCEDEALFAEYAPTTGGCAVLITSRYTGWSAAAGVTPLALDVLTRDASLALLRRHRPDLVADDPALDAIARELGDLPLALHLAGSFLETYRRDPVYGDPSHLLGELRDARLLDHEALKGIDMRPSPTNHDLHVGRTLALSLERLDEADPSGLARSLLARAACFAPGEPIPRDLLLSTVVAKDAEPAETRRASRALAQLQELGLLSGDAYLVLHRLVSGLVASEASSAVQMSVEQALIAWMELRFCRFAWPARRAYAGGGPE